MAALSSKHYIGVGGHQARDGDKTMTATKIILALALLASATTAVLGNAPGGAYIQCDPRNPSSPVRCTPDGW
jgi:hypothetical protein